MGRRGAARRDQDGGRQASGSNSRSANPLQDSLREARWAGIQPLSAKTGATTQVLADVTRHRCSYGDNQPHYTSCCWNDPHSLSTSRRRNIIASVITPQKHCGRFCGSWNCSLALFQNHLILLCRVFILPILPFFFNYQVFGLSGHLLIVVLTNSCFWMSKQS